jgi:hypothetical protein
VYLLFLCACIKTALIQLCNDKSQLSTIHDFAFLGLHPLGFPGGCRYARDQCVADILPFFTGRDSSMTFSASIESLPTMIHGIFYCILGKKSVSNVVLFCFIEGLEDTSVPALGHNSRIHRNLVTFTCHIVYTVFKEKVTALSRLP